MNSQIPTKIVPPPTPDFREKFTEYKLQTSKEILVLKVESFEAAIRPKGENYSRDNKKIHNQLSIF
jgi:hypothetical protein